MVSGPSCFVEYAIDKACQCFPINLYWEWNGIYVISIFFHATTIEARKRTQRRKCLIAQKLMVTARPTHFRLLILFCRPLTVWNQENTRYFFIHAMAGVSPQTESSLALGNVRFSSFMHSNITRIMKSDIMIRLHF